MEKVNLCQEVLFYKQEGQQLIPVPKEDEALAEFMSRCMRSGRIRTEVPDKKKRIRTINESWYNKKNTDQLIEVVNEYESKFKRLVSAHTTKLLSLEVESFPLGALHPKKVELFKEYYSRMRLDKVDIEDAYDLSIKKVNRLRMGMI